MKFLSQRNIKFIALAVILLITIFVSLRGADNIFKSSLLRISSPFLKTFRIFSGGIEGFFDFIGSIGDLKKENENLFRKNQELVSENARLKDAEKENESLRKELGLAPRKNFELEASFVIGQDPQGLGNYFIIDKGENAGIKPKMPVIVSRGVLVGRVSEVFATTARVILITDPESSINAEAENSEARGIVRGEFGLGIRMEMIPQTEIVNGGDRIVTSGLGGEMPRGLVIGRVSGVSQSADKLFQEASLFPEANFSKTRIIFIIKKF